MTNRRITLEKPRSAGDWLRIWLLYLNAFPPSERKPFSRIRGMYNQGRADVWCVQDQGKFRGFAATVNGGDLILLDYFAVVKNARGQGIGTRAMALLLEQYHDRGFFVEIESTHEDCPDRAMREKRRQFYLSAGLQMLGVEARVFDVQMELLGIRCQMDWEDYRNFYRDRYSPWAAEHIEKV